MKTKEITTKEYADLYPCSRSNVTKQIRNNRPLPLVLEVKKLGRDYVLKVPLDISAKLKKLRQTT